MNEIPVIINSTEVELYIESLKPSAIENLGSAAWFDDHQRLERLRQQCIVEATHHIEERVKDAVLAAEKVPVLVYEVVIIQIWRQKVWRKILKEQRTMHNAFIGYMILYHECTALNFLQILLHHRDTVQSLGDEALDIIDYCSDRLVYLLADKKSSDHQDENELTRLKNQEIEMSFSNGLASIAILASLSEYIGDLSMSAVVRIYDTHDVPLLMANLLESHPWKRPADGGGWEVYDERKWTPWCTEELSKSEAQCWIALRGLLLHPIAREHYNLTNNRRETLLKLQRYLYETVIDQMAPLLELKQLLGHLSVSGQSSGYKPVLILETVAPIKDALLCRGSKWKNLSERHISLIFDYDQRECAVEIAKSLAETYDTDIMSVLDKEMPKEKCHKCGKISTKKCSQCKSVSYCSRKCQVIDWNNHKIVCKAN